MTTAIRLYRTYILSTFVPLNTIRRLFRFFRAVFLTFLFLQPFPNLMDLNLRLYRIIFIY